MKRRILVIAPNYATFKIYQGNRPTLKDRMNYATDLDQVRGHNTDTMEIHVLETRGSRAIAKRVYDELLYQASVQKLIIRFVYESEYLTLETER